MTEYKFFKKIKPDTYLWCVSMQAMVKFEEEAWIGVVSEHTTWATKKSKVFYGNIFINTKAFGIDLTNNNIEFEVWEDSQTEGKRIIEQKDIPSNCQMPLYVDFPYMVETDNTKLTNCIKPIKKL